MTFWMSRKVESLGTLGIHCYVTSTWWLALLSKADLHFDDDLTHWLFLVTLEPLVLHYRNLEELQIRRKKNMDQGSLASR
mmetsp:Transcript_23625/g.38499  ORF Transcript_23625/g.38499 Transcript_23625/m.38499 type:complete len:80 (-) Transcript_23625:31-270(-)